MKKFGIALGIIVLLLVAIVVITPMIYDVNKLKPQIVNAIEQNLNAKAEIGNLSLSLWGGIYVGISELKITETVGPSLVFWMKDAKVSVPFSTLFGGHIDATVFTDSPTINLVKGKDGNLNALKMIKTSAQKPPAAAAENSSTSANGIANRISLSTRITNAKLSYQDLLTGSTSRVDKLDLNLANIGIGTPIKLDVRADLEVIQGKEIEVRGPLTVKGDAKLLMDAAGFSNADLEANINLDDLKVRYGSLFDKEPKVPLTIEAKMNVQPTTLKIEKLDLLANDFKINTVLAVSNLKAVVPVIDLKVTSNELELSRWRQIIAPLKQYDMAGKLGINVTAAGPTDHLNLGGTVMLKEASLRAPGVVPRVEHINSDLSFSLDTAALKNTTLQIGSSDIAVSGTVKNFKAPIVRVTVNSKKMNVDEIMGAAPAPKAAATPGKEISPEERDRQLQAMAQGPIDAIKSNPIMRQLDFVATAKVGQVIVHQAALQDLTAEVTFNKLVLALKDAQLKLYGGAASAKLSVDFNGNDPNYRMAGAAKAVNIDEAMTNQMPEFKGFITGRANATFDITGAGVTVAKAKQFLKGAGKFDVQNGTWSGLGAVKMIAEKLKSVPQIKDKANGLMIGNRFKTLNGNFDINDGRVNITAANMELDEAHTSLQMAGWINFDKVLDLTGNIEAPMSDVPPKLKAPDGRAKLPFEIAGAANHPELKWEVTLKPVAAAYFESEGKKALGNILQQQADKAGHGDQVKGLLKGLGL